MNKGIAQPGSIWKIQNDNYIQGIFFKKGKEIVIETIQVNVNDAFVIFMYGSRRMMMDIKRFRDKFKIVN